MTTTNVHSFEDPIEPKRVKEMATQTVRPLKPLPSDDTATLSTAAAKASLATTERLSKIEGKIDKLARNKHDWSSLSASVDLLAARQELILTKLDTIRNHQISDNNADGDSDISSLDSNLWAPVTPEEEDSCYEGAALCQCRHQEQWSFRNFFCVTLFKTFWTLVFLNFHCCFVVPWLFEEWPLLFSTFQHFLSIFDFFGFLLNTFDKETYVWWLGGKYAWREIGAEVNTRGRETEVKWNGSKQKNAAEVHPSEVHSLGPRTAPGTLYEVLHTPFTAAILGVGHSMRSYTPILLPPFWVQTTAVYYSHEVMSAIWLTASWIGS